MVSIYTRALTPRPLEISVKILTYRIYFRTSNMATWCVLLALTVINFPWVAPAPQSDGGLDALITSAFGTNSQTASPVTGSALDHLISDVFNQKQTTTTPNTILGTNNTKPPPGDCECVPYYQCRNGTISENGETLIDIRSGWYKWHYENGTEGVNSKDRSQNGKDLALCFTEIVHDYEIMLGWSYRYQIRISNIRSCILE